MKVKIVRGVVLGGKAVIPPKGKDGTYDLSKAPEVEVSDKVARELVAMQKAEWIDEEPKHGKGPMTSANTRELTA